jgi:hypothetical protein
MKTEKTPDQKYERSTQEKAVLAFSVIKTTFLCVVLGFLAKLGYEGFKAGEMGIMVGIFMIVIVLPLIPVCVLAIIVSIQMLKRKRWALIVSIFYSGVFALLSLLSITLGPPVFIITVSLICIMIFLELRVLNSDLYRKQSRPDAG